MLKTCPRCGRKLMVLNQEHVCGLWPLEPHFEKKDPIGQAAFTWMCQVFDALGPYDVLPMKTMIAFASGANLAFLKTKRTGADISLVLSERPVSDRITSALSYSRTKSIYGLRVLKEQDLDDELAAWLLQAYLLRPIQR